MEEGGRVRVVGGRTDMRNLEYRKREYTKYLRILLLIFYHDLRLTLGGFCGHEFGEVGERRRGGEGGDMRGKASRHRYACVSAGRGTTPARVRLACRDVRGGRGVRERELRTGGLSGYGSSG